MKHPSRWFFALSVVTLAAGCQSAPRSDASDASIRQALQAWVDAFNACTPSRSAALYAPDALLWGTVSPTLIDTPEGIRQYFERACLATPQPKVELGLATIRMQGDAATASGGYVFTLAGQGQTRIVAARFSFTYRRGDEGWLISSHHSSAAPSVGQAAPVPKTQ